jgi:hypothetical protein
VPNSGAQRSARPTWILKFLSALLFFGLARNSNAAETKLDFWHSYLHNPSGVTHYSFHLASYKRGLFFGSCGPSTRSLQWEYEVDLAGAGPAYEASKITVTSEGKKIDVASGTIKIDLPNNKATIDLRVVGGNATNSFGGNGAYRITKIKN